MADTPVTPMSTESAIAAAWAAAEKAEASLDQHDAPQAVGYATVAEAWSAIAQALPRAPEVPIIR
ncbi:MAG: hypothetical protein JWN46_1007 [Acidimicrobiales bacterium]|nr:hypothetical protein [Acidimicrobiales bacterium]